ncbi:selenide, water dikinase 1-like [Schistocerca nitens]|uniref:selenide, water dikinase 1-like n=1 Tax=Schistocerca nitens TaxID=7011 RepID=UPI002119403B|nr:selenide, water dikinase 1-like [Schistocerca nitens]
MLPADGGGPLIDAGLDSAVITLPRHGLFLLQTTDFFYPLIDDPYIMGGIACANVLSDLYAMGVSQIDSVLMIIAPSSKFSDKERDVILPLLAKGFENCAKRAGTRVTGGHTGINPWCIIGGVATSVCTQDEFVMPNEAKPGDVLVLTKPLGTQVAVVCHSWLNDDNRWPKLEPVITIDAMQGAYNQAVDFMSRLNKTGAELMLQYQAHGATDVTGFGILGHAQNLAKYQKNEVSFVIDTLPVIAGIAAIGTVMTGSLNIRTGRVPETSGGLFICLDETRAHEFIREFSAKEGYEPWIIGTVCQGQRTAQIKSDATILEIA